MGQKFGQFLYLECVCKRIFSALMKRLDEIGGGPDILSGIENSGQTGEALWMSARQAMVIHG